MCAELGCVPDVEVVGVLGVALVLGFYVVDVDRRCGAVRHCVFRYGYVAEACGSALSSHGEGYRGCAGRLVCGDLGVAHLRAGYVSADGEGDCCAATCLSLYGCWGW